MSAGESDNTAVIESVGQHTGATGANSADVEAEAQQDAVLARIFDGEQGTSAHATGDRTRDDSGRFTGKSNDKGKEKPEAKSAQSPEPSAVPEGVKADDYRKALKALQFDGVPQKTLDALSPHELVEWGIKRAANHADVDRIKSQFGELKKAKEAAGKSKETPPEPTIDVAGAVEPFAKQLAEYMGVDVKEFSGPLSEFAKTLLASNSNSALQSKLEAIERQFTDQQRDSARSKLSEKYDLDQDERWGRVLERRAADKNEYASEQEAIDAACRYEFADEIIAMFESKLKEQHKLRDKGQSTAQHAKTPPKSQTTEDQEDQILNAILDGDRDKASRLGRSSYRGANEEALVG